MMLTCINGKIMTYFYIPPQRIFMLKCYFIGMFYDKCFENFSISVASKEIPYSYFEKIC